MIRAVNETRWKWEFRKKQTKKENTKKLKPHKAAPFSMILTHENSLATKLLSEFDSFLWHSSIYRQICLRTHRLLILPRPQFWLAGAASRMQGRRYGNETGLTVNVTVGWSYISLPPPTPFLIDIFVSQYFLFHQYLIGTELICWRENLLAWHRVIHISPITWKLITKCLMQCILNFEMWKPRDCISEAVDVFYTKKTSSVWFNRRFFGLTWLDWFSYFGVVCLSADALVYVYQHQCSNIMEMLVSTGQNKNATLRKCYQICYEMVTAVAQQNKTINKPILGSQFPRSTSLTKCRLHPCGFGADWRVSKHCNVILVVQGIWMREPMIRDLKFGYNFDRFQSLDSFCRFSMNWTAPINCNEEAE